MRPSCLFEYSITTLIVMPVVRNVGNWREVCGESEGGVGVGIT